MSKLLAGLLTAGLLIGTVAVAQIGGTGDTGFEVEMWAGPSLGRQFYTRRNFFSLLGTAPAVSSCGTGPSIVGDDRSGEVTMGTSATGCVITFAAAYVAAPICVVSWQATPLASQSYSASTTALTLVQTSTSSNKADYYCSARNGG